MLGFLREKSISKNRTDCVTQHQTIFVGFQWCTYISKLRDNTYTGAKKKKERNAACPPSQVKVKNSLSEP